MSELKKRWNATVVLSCLENDTINVRICVDSEDEATARAGVDFIYERLIGENAAHVRDEPEVNGDRDFCTGVVRFGGYARFTILPFHGKREKAEPPTIFEFGQAEGS